MDEYEDISVAPTILPGVDLTLWLRLGLSLLLAILVGVVAAVLTTR
jgi:hypothetical protein